MLKTTLKARIEMAQGYLTWGMRFVYLLMYLTLLSRFIKMWRMGIFFDTNVANVKVMLDIADLIASL